MKGRHATRLVYRYEPAVDEPVDLEVGEVSCVPRKGELVVLPVKGETYHLHTFRVDQVEWRPVVEARDVFAATPCTIVRVSLSRCP